VDSEGEVAFSELQLIQAGAQLFTFNCAPCHQSNGEGNLSRFPALNDSPLVTAQMPTALIETVLYGRQEMPAFAPTLNNAELAAVLSYVRQAWSNQASIIEPEQIQEVRQQHEQTSADRRRTNDGAIDNRWSEIGRELHG
jgi:cytochrome c oxidase subunit 2